MNAQNNFRPFPEMVLALFKGMNNPAEYLMHATIGIAGEVGEIIDAIASPDGDLLEELGDFRFYVEAVFQPFGWSMESFEGVKLPGINVNCNNRNSLGRTGLVIESAAMLDIAKKVWVYNKELDVQALFDHTAVLLHFYRRMLAAYLYTDEQVMEANQIKLCIGTATKPARYPQGVYTDAAAQARADKAVPASISGGTAGYSVGEAHAAA